MKFKVTPVEEMSWMQRRRQAKKVAKQNKIAKEYHEVLKEKVSQRREETGLVRGKDAQKIILAALLGGEKLTVKRGLLIAGTTETRSVVSRLIRKGYNIKSQKVAGENFNEYWIP